MISRQFAAMLQMLNDGNLAIDKEEGEWTRQSCGKMDLIGQFKVKATPLSRTPPVAPTETRHVER